MAHGNLGPLPLVNVPSEVRGSVKEHSAINAIPESSPCASRRGIRISPHEFIGQQRDF